MPVMSLDKITIEQNGFVHIKSVIDTEQIDQLIESVETARQSKDTPGLRNLLSRNNDIRNFANHGKAYEIAAEILAVSPRAVRAILFDKTPASNWYVTWHQDLSIPVKGKKEIDGYGPWSVKEGVLHVQPPAAILEKMISLRIHLDECSEENGAIKFIPGSHRAGVLDSEQLALWRENHVAAICPANRGDVIAMRPLILHSSSVSTEPQSRRVLHIEYSTGDLPDGLEWAEA